MFARASFVLSRLNVSRLKMPIILFVFLFVGVVVHGAFAGQDVNFDQLNYHSYDVYALLHWRYNLDVAPAQSVHSYLNPIIYIPWYLSNNLVSPRCAMLVQALLQSLNVVPLFFLIRLLVPDASNARHAIPVTCMRSLSVILAFVSPMFWTEAGTSFADSIVSVPVLAGLVSFLSWLDTRRDWLLLLSGACMGVATGLKLTSVVYATALVVLLLVLYVARTLRMRDIALHVAGAMIGLAGVSGWIFALCQYKFGNPFFPYFNGLFRSAEAGTVLNMDTRYLPHSAWEALSLFWTAATGGQATSELYFRDIRPLLSMVILAVLVIFLIRTRKFASPGVSSVQKKLILAWGFVIISTILWIVVFSIQRYWLVNELFIGLLCGASLSLLVGQRLALAGMMAAIVASAITIRISDFGHTAWLRTPYATSMPQSFIESDVVFLAGQPLSYLSKYFQHSASIVGFVDGNLHTSCCGDSFYNQIKTMLERPGVKPVVVFQSLSDPERHALDVYGWRITGHCSVVSGYHRDELPVQVCAMSRI